MPPKNTIEQQAAKANKLRHKDLILKKLAIRESNYVHVSSLVERIFVAWGGEDEFAAEMASEFRAAAPGSNARARIISIIGKLLEFHTTTQGKVDPYRELSTEDLKRQARNLLGVNEIEAAGNEQEAALPQS
jgi:hypothetical protein